MAAVSVIDSALRETPSISFHLARGLLHRPEREQRKRRNAMCTLVLGLFLRLGFKLGEQVVEERRR